MISKDITYTGAIIIALEYTKEDSTANQKVKQNGQLNNFAKNLIILSVVSNDFSCK